MFSQNGNQPISVEFRGCFPHAEEFGNDQINKINYLHDFCFAR